MLWQIRLLLALFAFPLSGTPVWGAGRDLIAQTVESFLLDQAVHSPGQTSVEIGQIADNERYATCQQWEASLGEGVRPWGQVSVAVRCRIGARLSLYVPAKVRIRGQYLVAARTIAAGQTIGSEDLRLVDGELTAQAPDLLLSKQEAIGQAARSGIPVERPLRAAHLRQESVVSAGQTVKIIARGAGFAVANEGQALSSANRGQSVRIRLQNGGTATGTAIDKGLVELH